jgi:hypothetical protein
VYQVDFKATGVDGHWIEPVNRLPPEVVSAYPAKNGGVVAQPPGHHGEV